MRGADRVYVEFRDGERVPASIVGYDLFADIGVIRVASAGHRLDRCRSATPRRSSSERQSPRSAPRSAIRAPGGGRRLPPGDRSPRSTSSYAVADAIQTDAPINRGNSGGPLLEPAGRVIGVNAQIRSNSGNAEGVGFAIPINVARRSLSQLVATGRVAYAYIGIQSRRHAGTGPSLSAGRSARRLVTRSSRGRRPRRPGCAAGPGRPSSTAFPSPSAGTSSFASARRSCAGPRTSPGS